MARKSNRLGVLVALVAASLLPGGAKADPPCACAGESGGAGPGVSYSPWAYRTPLLYRLCACIRLRREGVPVVYPNGPTDFLVITDPVYYPNPSNLPPVPGRGSGGNCGAAEAGTGGAAAAPPAAGSPTESGPSVPAAGAPPPERP
jgi:hypothetical protein